MLHRLNRYNRKIQFGNDAREVSATLRDVIRRIDNNAMSIDNAVANLLAMKKDNLALKKFVQNAANIADNFD